MTSHSRYVSRIEVRQARRSAGVPSTEALAATHVFGYPKYLSGHMIIPMSLMTSGSHIVKSGGNFIKNYRLYVVLPSVGAVRPNNPYKLHAPPLWSGF